VLIFQIGSLGDTIVTIPALRAVRRHFGDAAELTLLHSINEGIPVIPADVLAGSALVDKFIGYPFVRGDRVRQLLVTAKLWWRLRRACYDWVVSLAPAERPAASLQRDQLFFRQCGIKRQAGFQPFPETEFHARDADGRPVTVSSEAIYRLRRLERDGIAVVPELDFAAPLLTAPPDELEKALSWLASGRKYPDRPLVAICPGSQMPAKEWPLDRFVEIGRRLLELERFELVVVGGPAEQAMGDLLLSEWGTGLNAAGKFSVLGSGALLSLCEFMFGLDTGTTHLAAALGTPSLTLYSERANPGQWEPMGRNQVVLCHPVPCSGCRERVCPVAEHPCMTGISVATAWSKLEEHLLGPQRGDAELVVYQV
jgi:ADP-heptose:LPS heptosyltransferase